MRVYIKYFVLLFITFLCAGDQVSAQNGWRKIIHAKAVSPLTDDEEEMEEDTIRGFSFGLNLGTYFASKKSAIFYNGACSSNEFIDVNEVRCYSIADRLGVTGNNAAFNQTYNKVLNEVGNGATGFDVPYDSYPANMRYSPAFLVGLNIKYAFNRYSAILFNVNGIKLKSVDIFTLRFYGGTLPVNAQSDVRKYTIVGQEQRFNLGLGYRHGWYMNDYANFYLQGGASMLGTQFENNYLQIGESNYDLFVGVQNQNTLVRPQPNTEVTFGGYGAMGVEFFFNKKLSFDLSFGMNREKVVIFSLEQKGWHKWIQATFTI
ncbi:MAG: hypothetical protein RLZZ262_2288 [Bacteroidota bacterium]